MIAREASEDRMDDVRERFQNLHEFLKAAKFNLNRNNWDYIVGGTETETTLARNRQSLDSIAFKPRVLRNVRSVDCTSELYGRKVRLPVLIAPVGGLQNFWAGGVATVAKAAGEFGIPMMQSSATEPALEETAKQAPDAYKIFQLYVRGDDTFVDDIYARSQKAGFVPQFCFTVDLAHYSRRERDVVKRFNRIANRRQDEHDTQAGFDWAVIERFAKRHPKAEIIIKGIQTGEDAQIALDSGIKGIYVTNHGGRALDHARGAMDILPEVVEVVKGRVPIIVDGGFYRGTDILKAIAMGATAVGLGRLYCYALAAAGAPGIVRMLELLEDEMRRDLGLMGLDSLKKLDKSYVCTLPPAKPADVFSAYNLADMRHDPY
jgi:isopentenyl diphosphate isomerase/L-lactate dehydrogenase-like FMN-dependent dehydrogenase